MAKAGDRKKRRGSKPKRQDKLVSVQEEDHLEEDDPILGQKFVCMSFIAPDDALPRKDVFYFEKYCEEVFKLRVESFASACVKTPEKASEFANVLVNDLSDLQSDYSSFLANSQVRLDDDFASRHPLKLTMSGFKVRGSYPDQESARKRAEALQRRDRSVDVFVAQVGAWCPFKPPAESIGEVVYDESQLNTMMKLKKEADESREAAYHDGLSGRVEKTREDVTACQVLESIEEDEDPNGDGGEAADSGSDQSEGEGEGDDGPSTSA